MLSSSLVSGSPSSLLSLTLTVSPSQLAQINMMRQNDRTTLYVSWRHVVEHEEDLAEAIMAEYYRSVAACVCAVCVVCVCACRVCLCVSCVTCVTLCDVCAGFAVCVFACRVCHLPAGPCVCACVMCVCSCVMYVCMHVLAVFAVCVCACVMYVCACVMYVCIHVLSLVAIAVFKARPVLLTRRIPCSPPHLHAAQL